jgi:endonuclease YncB( thermonuclease family)
MKTLLALCVMVFSFVAQANTSWPMISGQGTVYRVIDGDTLIVNTDSATYKKLKAHASNKGLDMMNDKYNSFRIRLAAIDTPESVHRDSSRNTQSGKNASDFMKKLSSNKVVGFRCWAVGKYGRFICSAELQETAEDLGLTLIRSGYAKYVTKFGKHPYLHDEYQKAQSMQ